MSILLVDHKHTLQTQDAFGVTWWENPNLNITLNSLGEIHKNDLTNEKVEGAVSSNGVRVYNAVIETPKGNEHFQASFNAIYARMVLGKRILPAYTIYLKNPKKGYLPANVDIKPAPKQLKHVNGSNVQPVLQLQPQAPETTSELFYTHHLAVEAHTTEDGAVFHNKDEAAEHQRYVAKGKSNAQVVLDHVTDYNLAEQIYFQEVKYSGKVPYLNFRDVMDNNAGMVSSVLSEHAIFDKIPPTILQWIQSEGIYDFRALEMSLKQAELVQEKLEQFLLKRASFVSTILSLKTTLVGRFNAKES
jgi:hypothetical protein